MKPCHRSQIRTRFGRGGAQNNPEVDLALAVMCALARPGQCFSAKTIAEVTGMSHQGPAAIEQRALKKLRHRARLLVREEFVS